VKLLPVPVPAGTGTGTVTRGYGYTRTAYKERIILVVAMTITTQHDEKGQFTAHSQENFHLRQADSLSGCKLVLNDDVSEHLG